MFAFKFCDMLWCLEGAAGGVATFIEELHVRCGRGPGCAKKIQDRQAEILLAIS